MKPSTPIYQLKRKAKILSRDQQIPLHEAQNRIAVKEGFKTWSLLAAQHSELSPAGRLYSQLKPGNLILLGARPGQGKTLMGLELAIEATKAGRRSIFFSLEYTEKECRERLHSIGLNSTDYGNLFEFDGSEPMDASHIIGKMATCDTGTVAVIDYLQLLDQNRSTSDLMTQVRNLRSFSREKGVIVIFISQIDRNFDPDEKPCPDWEDVRLPNPLDLKLFDKACFIHNGEVRFSRP